MKTFREFLLEYVGPIYRLDDRKINRFQTKEYAHTPDWSSSGTNFRTRVGLQHNNVLFGGEKKEVASYAVPRDVPWVRHETPQGKSTLYFHPRDKERIQSHHPTLTRFAQAGWKKLPAPGEYVNKKPARQVSQSIIHDPISFMRSQGHDIKWTSDLQGTFNKVVKKNGFTRGEGVGPEDNP